MKTTLKTSKIFEVQNMINGVGGITAGKLGYALSRNAVRVEEVTKAVVDQLKGSKELQAWRIKRQQISATVKNYEEAEAQIEALKDSMKVRDEITALEEKERELLDMETEVDWFDVPLSYIPGMAENDSNKEGVLPLAAMKLFFAAGMIVDDLPKSKADRPLKAVKNEE